MKQEHISGVPLSPNPVLAVYRNLILAVYRCPLCEWRFIIRDDLYNRSVRTRIRFRLSKHMRRSHPDIGARERSILSDLLVNSPPLLREGQKEKV